MKSCSLLVVNAGELASPLPRDAGATPASSSLLRIEDGAVAIDGKRIAEVGPTSKLVAEWDAKETLDASGGSVTPALCDPHTHLLFAGWREEEFGARVSGLPMRGRGLSGGIGSTVSETAAASDGTLEQILRERLDHWLISGVTLVEIKSGYGLTAASELRMLEIIHRVSENHVVEVVGTVLAAHSLPASYEGRAYAYLDEIAWPVTLRAHARGLAEYADIFVEEGAFKVSEAERYLNRVRDLGMGLRVHADQLSACGGAALGARIGAASVDHLEHAGIPEVKALAGSGAVAVLLPGAILTVEGRGGRRPPARQLLDAGVPVAIATDFNPGTSTQSSPVLSMGLATRLLGLTPEESLTAATRDAARSLGRGRVTGTIAAGQRADLCVWDVPRASHLAYSLNSHRPRHVVASGQVAVRDGKLP
jgi:imidazolonepropionase